VGKKNFLKIVLYWVYCWGQRGTSERVQGEYSLRWTASRGNTEKEKSFSSRGSRGLCGGGIFSSGPLFCGQKRGSPS